MPPRPFLNKLRTTEYGFDQPTLTMERGLIEQHLSHCSACAEQLEMVRDSRRRMDERPMNPTAPVAEEELPEKWRGVRFHPSLIIPYAAAAGLLIVSLSLGWWVVSLRRENNRLAGLSGPGSAGVGSPLHLREQLQQAARRLEQSETEMAQLRQTVDEFARPQLSPPLQEIRAPEVRRSRGGDAPDNRVTFASGVHLVNVTLTVDGPPAAVRYAVEILDRQGKLIWEGTGRRQNRDDDYEIGLWRSVLAPGPYRINLYTFRRDQKRLLQSYQVRVEHR
jgi:hypothetical protein